MRILNRLFGSSKAQAADGETRGFNYHPYKSKEANYIYDLLFCDNLELYKNNFKGEKVFPWDVLFSSSRSREDLEKIINDPKCESRVKVLTYNELRRLGIKSPRKELLGVIVEVGMKDGLDTLAVYADKTARYINYTGKMIIWETIEDAIINAKIAELFKESEQVISSIGPWDKERLPPLMGEEARITFLVSDGLCFGQGEMDALSNDSMSGPVLNTATELMKLLINKSLGKQK